MREIEALTGSMTKLCILTLACQGKYIALFFCNDSDPT